MPRNSSEWAAKPTAAGGCIRAEHHRKRVARSPFNEGLTVTRRVRAGQNPRRILVVTVPRSHSGLLFSTSCDIRAQAVGLEVTRFRRSSPGDAATDLADSRSSAVNPIAAPHQVETTWSLFDTAAGSESAQASQMAASTQIWKAGRNWLLRRLSVIASPRDCRLWDGRIIGPA
jgi:hypothetical protein